MRAGLYKFALTAAAVCAPLSAAHAQEAGDRGTILISPDFDRGDVAGARSEPSLSPRPILVGPFSIDASLATIAAYESNVRNQSNAGGDASLTLTPRLRVRTLSEGFQLRFGATGVFRRYASFSTENAEEFDLNGGISTELSQNASVSLSTSYIRESETRGTVGSTANAAEPADSNAFNTALNANLSLGNLRISPGVHYSERDYSDVDLVGGGQTDLSFRDMREIGGRLSVGYEISPLVSVFTAGTIDEIESTNPAPGAERDGTNFTLVAGIRGELSPVIIAEVAAGYRERNFDLARYSDRAGATFRANVQWFFTPLLSFRLQATQRSLNSGRVDVSDVLSTRVSASAYYDPLRNLRLAMTVGYTRNDFRDVDTAADRALLRAQMQYFVNRNISLGGYTSIIRQNVSGTPLIQSNTAVAAGIGVILTP